MAKNANNKVSIWQSLHNAWKVQDIRKKLIYTFFMLSLFRLVGVIPAPGVDYVRVKSAMSGSNLPLLDLVNMMTGSNFSNMTIMAMGITPYINSSIIMQLLTIAIPALERLQKEGGEEGRKKIQSITRYTTVGIAILQAVGYYFMMRNYNLLASDATGIWPALVIVVSFIAGSSFVMWMGEQVNEFGVGNGISIILFASIIARFPSSIGTMITNGSNGSLAWWALALVIIGALAIIVLIVIVNDAERRIPVQYSKRVVGRKLYGGQSTHIPIKVAMSGVMPIIFASSILSIPSTIQLFMGTNVSGFWQSFFEAFSSTGWLYSVLYFILIILFAYFYVTIQYNPIEMANNLRQNNGTIPGIRPGKPTSDFISKILSKITLIGALFLAVIALLPILFGAATGMHNLSLGGTSVIILVGVALDTMKQMESQMMMRHYKGFLD